MIQYTVESLDAAENLIQNLFRKTLIADVMEYKQDISRAYLSSSGNMVPVNKLHKLVMVSGDDRVAELISELSGDLSEKEGPPTDVLVTPLATGSKEYIQWVKTQTLKKDGSTSFFNVSPPKIKTEIPQDVTDLLEDTKIMEKVDLDEDLDINAEDEDENQIFG